MSISIPVPSKVATAAVNKVVEIKVMFADDGGAVARVDRCDVITYSDGGFSRDNFTSLEKKIGPGDKTSVEASGKTVAVDELIALIEKLTDTWHEIETP